MQSQRIAEICEIDHRLEQHRNNLRNLCRAGRGSGEKAFYLRELILRLHVKRNNLHSKLKERSCNDFLLF